MRQAAVLIALLLAGSLLAASCAPGPPAGEGRPAPGPSAAGRTLVMIAGAEAATFATRPLASRASGSRGIGESRALLNATLVYRDERGRPVPYLAEALPELNSASWRVFPDGTMETVYRLRPNLTWHDGTPLVAEDFVFAWRLYANPTFGGASSPPIGLMEEILAPDPRHVVIRWRGSYPEAAELEDGFPPLPRHILEPLYQQLSADAFVNQPFWADEYVGLGAYRLDRREPGVSFDASAFDAHALGRPRIDRVRVVYMSDPNAAVANLLSGAAHLVLESLIWGEEGIVLQREWGSSGGTVMWEPLSSRNIQIQVRPEYALPPQLIDVRVRRALAHALDKEAAFEPVTAGYGLMTDTFTHPLADYYEAVDRAVTKYRHDPRRAHQLLEDVGFALGRDGFWAGPTGDRITLEVWFIAGSTNERENAIFVESLRRFGIDATSHVWGVQSTSNEARSKLPGIFAGAGGEGIGFTRYHGKEIPRPENRWTGNNRGGYVNPEIDRLVDAFEITLERSERIQQIVQMERIISQEVPTILLYYTPRVVAHVGALRGPTKNLTPDAGAWARRVHLWEWQF